MRFPQPQSARFLAAGAALLVHGGMALAWLAQDEQHPPVATMQVISVALVEKKAAASLAPAPESEPEPPQPVKKPEPPQPVAEPEPIPVTERPTPMPKPAKQPPKPVQQPVEQPAEAEVAEAAPAPVQPEITDAGQDDQTQEAVETAITPPVFDAAYLHNPPPVYPRVARRLKQEGTVELRVRVSPEGTAAELAVARSSGVPVLDSAALDAVRRWRFVPAQRGDKAVEAWVIVPVQFTLES